MPQYRHRRRAGLGGILPQRFPGVITSQKGQDASLVLYGSDFTTLQHAVDYLIALDDWYEELDPGSATATANTGDYDIVIAAGTLATDGVLQPGDIFSPNDGLDWYTIDAIPDDVTLTLRCVLQVANIAGVSFRIARPKYRRLYLDANTSLHTMDFSDLQNKPIFLDVVNTSNHVFRPGLGTPGMAATTVKIPLQGALRLANINVDTVESNTANAGFGETTVVSGRAATSHIDLHYCNAQIQGPDVFSPSTSIGSWTIVGGLYDNGGNDMMFWGPQGKFKAYDATFIARTRTISGILLPPQLFSYGPHEMKRCTIIADNSNGDGINDTGIQGTSSIYPDGTDASTWDDCNIYFTGGTNAFHKLIKSFGGGLATDRDWTLNNCVIDASGVAGGTVELVETAVYTGTGSLTCNGCTLTNMANGGGGTFTITINP